MKQSVFVTVLATAANFNLQGYLRANQDVAESVKAGFDAEEPLGPTANARAGGKSRVSFWSELKLCFLVLNLIRPHSHFRFRHG